MHGPVTPRAIVLAAGASRQFGGRKLVAPFFDRPVIEHVIEAIRGAGLTDSVIVVGHDAAEVQAAVRWQGERLVRNPEPDRGLSSSLQIGLGALGPEVDAAIILLGDQPLVDRAVIRRLADEPLDATRPILVASYPADGAPNPVRAERIAWAMADELTGERGFGAIIASHPELVRRLEVSGDNPDIDTPVDLAILTWAAQVRANREQVDRLRETPDGKDFYGPVSAMFVADPDRTDDPTLDALIGLAGSDDVWLDIGAGAGRYALPIARRVREVVAIDPSASMLDALRSAMSDHGIANIRPLEGRWPPDASADAQPHGDVALIAHVGYDVEAIGPFLDAMEAAADRLCVAVLMTMSPAVVAAPFWPPIHGEERVPLPALPQFIDLLRARGREPSVRIVERAARTFASGDELERMVRRQLWVGEGTAKERLMRDLLSAWTVEVDGGVQLRDQGPLEVGIATWAPRR